MFINIPYLKGSLPHSSKFAVSRRASRDFCNKFSRGGSGHCLFPAFEIGIGGDIKGYFLRTVVDVGIFGNAPVEYLVFDTVGAVGEVAGVAVSTIDDCVCFVCIEVIILGAVAAYEGFTTLKHISTFITVFRIRNVISCPAGLVCFAIW